MLLPISFSEYEAQVSLPWGAQTRLCVGDSAAGELLTAARPAADRGEGGLREICFEEIPPQSISRQFGSDSEASEQYAILIVRERIAVQAASRPAMLYAAETLLQLLDDNGCFPVGRFYDVPQCPVRGLKLMLPAADKMADFKRLIDLAAAMKYNTVMLEIGGAMEYRRHPEINEGWLEYCAFMNEYPGKGQEIQEKTAWERNSIHSDNGGGGCLTQAQVKELAAYCRDRHFQVIPEVPLLSHCDYLLTRHPELAERAEDPWPDTYCPSNPASYELAFDVLDEIIEVFRPEIINIGHDEYYTIGLCERCRNRQAPDIYAEDIRKIHDYLADRRVKTMLWGEKLLPARLKDGYAVGGSECGWRSKIPATWTAIDQVPKDLLVSHWYWGIDRKLEQYYIDRNLAYVFGNFEPAVFPDFNRRVAQPSCRGGIISNWGRTDLLTMQRNLILFNMAYGAFRFWLYSFEMWSNEEQLQAVFAYLYHLNPAAAAGENKLTLEHYTTRLFQWGFFYDGKYIKPEEYCLGSYLVTFRDGSHCELPVCYGQNIGSGDVAWTRQEADNMDTWRFDESLPELSYSTLPVKADGVTFYRTDFQLPQPASEVSAVEFRPKGDSIRVVFRRR